MALLSWRPCAALAAAFIAAGCSSSESNEAPVDVDAASDTQVADVTPPADADAAIEWACGEPTATFKRCPQNPLLRGWRATAGGRFEWTMADPSILYDEDDRVWRAWWSTVIVAKCSDAPDLAKREVSVKYAESKDGLAWTVASDLALGSRRGTTTWDDTTVETPTVIKVKGAPPDRRFVMVYAGGNDVMGNVLGQTPWQLGLAFSPDGKHFTRLPAAESPYAGKNISPLDERAGLILLGRDAFPGFTTITGGIVADPEIVLHDDVYHLWFSSAGVDKDGKVAIEGSKIAYGISHATSKDLVRWTMQVDNPFIPGGGQPAVVVDAAGQFQMWFSRDTKEELAGIPSALFPTLGFWHVTSKDGVVWPAISLTRELAWDKSAPGENLGMINGSAVVRRGAEYRLYFGAWSSSGVPDGSCAFVNGGGGITSGPGVFTLDVATRK